MFRRSSHRLLTSKGALQTENRSHDCQKCVNLLSRRAKRSMGRSTPNHGVFMHAVQALSGDDSRGACACPEQRQKPRSLDLPQMERSQPHHRSSPHDIHTSHYLLIPCHSVLAARTSSPFFLVEPSQQPLRTPGKPRKLASTGRSRVSQRLTSARHPDLDDSSNDPHSDSRPVHDGAVRRPILRHVCTIAAKALGNEWRCNQCLGWSVAGDSACADRL